MNTMVYNYIGLLKKIIIELKVNVVSAFLGMRIFVHGSACTPRLMLNALSDYALKSAIHDVELIHIHLDGEAKFAGEEFDGI